MGFPHFDESDARASDPPRRAASVPDAVHEVSVLGEALQIRFDDACMTLATYRNLVILVWHEEPPQLGHVDLFMRALDSLVERFPQGVGTLIVFQKGTRPGGPEVERMFTQGLQRLAPALGAEALVMEADGFTAAAFRSIVASMQRTLGRREGRRIFGNVSDSASWLSERMRESGEEALASAAVHSAVAAVRDFHARKRER